MLSGMVRVKVSAVLAVGYFEILGGYIVTAFSSSGSAMAIAPDWGRGFGLLEAYTTASGSSAIGGSPIKGCAALPGDLCFRALRLRLSRPFPIVSIRSFRPLHFSASTSARSKASFRPSNVIENRRLTKKFWSFQNFT